MTVKSLGVEIITTPDESAWQSVEQGPWTQVKIRKGIPIDWSRLYRALRRNTSDPQAILRSDDEMPDEFEVRNCLAQMVPPAQGAGFSRIMFECGNEPNNLWDWPLSRWLNEAPQYIAGWLRAQADWPAINFISTPMRPDTPSTLQPWHLGAMHNFRLKGAHVYSQGSLFWEPAHVEQFLGGPVVVTELNQSSGPGGVTRVPANLEMLKTISVRCSTLEAITFFCSPNNQPEWSWYGVTAEEAAPYGQWFRQQQQEEPSMSFNPQEVMDYWFSAPWEMPKGANGEPLGYNEEDAFGVFLSQYDLRIGAQKCSDRQFGNYLFRFYATGLLYCKVGDWSNIKVAYGIQGLPPKA